ncbi:hypothetical protein Tco_0733977 [Tanacetum coccineum]
MILAAQSEAFKQENVLAERLRGLDQQMEIKGDESLYFIGSNLGSIGRKCMVLRPMQKITWYIRERIKHTINLETVWYSQRIDKDKLLYNSKEWNSSDDQLRLRWIIYLVVLADAAESSLEDIIRACVIEFGDSYHLSIRCDPFEALYGGKYRSPVLWAEIGESSLTGLDLVQETTDKPLEFEVEDRVLLKVMPWKGVVHFGKKDKLAPRYVGPFEILERMGLIAYRLRLLEELNSVHDTFHVSNLKKCLADTNIHVPLDEIKVDKTLCFVEETVEIKDREVKRLKRRKIALVKVRWNLKHGPEFT